jgi:uncharacterized protein (DUF305 family)
MKEEKMNHKDMMKSYQKLGLALLINTVIMFILTFVMIDRMEHFVVNLNRIYMALIMAAPMGLVMMLVMGSMFKNKRLNAVLYLTFAGLTVLFFLLIRTQTPVGDVQFLRSMIPHHSGAILMCERSTITDQEIIELCGEIVQTQEEEIAQMEAILQRMR